MLHPIRQGHWHVSKEKSRFPYDGCWSIANPAVDAVYCPVIRSTPKYLPLDMSMKTGIETTKSW
jgi:hypothetical protein